MIGLRVLLDGDSAFKDIPEDQRDLRNATLDTVAMLQMGTVAGKPSVALLIRTDDGKHLIAQTTLALLRSAVLAMIARSEMMEQQGGGQPS